MWRCEILCRACIPQSADLAQEICARPCRSHGSRPATWARRYRSSLNDLGHQVGIHHRWSAFPSDVWTMPDWLYLDPDCYAAAAAVAAFRPGKTRERGSTTNTTTTPVAIPPSFQDGTWSTRRQGNTPPRTMSQAELLQQPERAQTLSDSYTEKYFVGFSAGADLHPTPHDLSIHGRRALFDFCETRHMMRSSKYASPKHWFRVNFKNAILLSTKPIQKCTIFSKNKNGPFGVTWVKIG